MKPDNQNKEYIYDVAISFAEEDRNAALALALALELKGLKKVYYYPYQLQATAGKILNEELKEIYSKKSKYSVVLLSKKYLKKETARLELQAIYKRVLQQPGIVSVILVILKKDIDLSEFPFLKKLGYLSWNFDPKAVVNVLMENLGQRKIDEMGEFLSEKPIRIEQKNEAINARDQKNEIKINL